MYVLCTCFLCFSTGYENDDAYTMEIFDTRSVRSYNVVDVLKASCDAPVVFQTPTTIKGVHYVDGGVGGNCPLVQAIPRMQELHNAKKLACKGSRPNSALSIAPPQLDGIFLKEFKLLIFVYHIFKWCLSFYFQEILFQMEIRFFFGWENFPNKLQMAMQSSETAKSFKNSWTSN